MAAGLPRSLCTVGAMAGTILVCQLSPGTRMMLEIVIAGNVIGGCFQRSMRQSGKVNSECVRYVAALLSSEAVFAGVAGGFMFVRLAVLILTVTRRSFVVVA